MLAGFSLAAAPWHWEWVPNQQRVTVDDSHTPIQHGSHGETALQAQEAKPPPSLASPPPPPPPPCSSFCDNFPFADKCLMHGCSGCDECAAGQSNSTASADRSATAARRVDRRRLRLHRGAQLLARELSPRPTRSAAALSASPEPRAAQSPPIPPVALPPSAPPSSPPNCERWCLNFAGSSEKHCEWRECFGCADCPAASPSPLADAMSADDDEDGAWPRLAPWRPPPDNDAPTPSSEHERRR